eukprot:4108514-Pyramimonas_sp.AAC.1
MMDQSDACNVGIFSRRTNQGGCAPGPSSPPAARGVSRTAPAPPPNPARGSRCPPRWSASTPVRNRAPGC